MYKRKKQHEKIFNHTTLLFIMKKNTFIKAMLFLVMLATGTVQGFGQHRIVEAQYPSAVNHTIVREYNHPATVSYVETATAHYFAYADAAMLVLNAEIDPNIYVRDFVIFEDYVYFCGWEKLQQTTKGIWGWFNINALMQSNMNYHVYDDFDCGQLNADTLQSLVAFRDNTNTLHIAVVGSVYDGSASDRSCMLDITGAAGGNAWTYRMGVTPKLEGYYEKISKVCLTNNYVVTVGSVPVGYGVVNHRVHLRNNMFQPGGLQDNAYYFPGDVSPRAWNFAICPVDGDMVAVAVKHDANAVFPSDGALVYVFHVPSLSVGMNALNAIRLDLGTSTNTSDIYGLRYSRHGQEITMLMSGNTMYGVGSVVFEWPVATLPPTAKPFFLPDRMMTSMDNYNTQQHFLTMGYDNSNPSAANFFIQPLQSNGICSVEELAVRGTVDFAVEKDSMPYTTCSKQIVCGEKIPQIYFPLVQDVKCSD